ncbi:hypothetical protein P7C70_g4314, partial [Phenoliferia sp. Uapishka_3]
MAFRDRTGLIAWGTVPTDMQYELRELPLEEYFTFDRDDCGNTPIYNIMSSIHLGPPQATASEMLEFATVVTIPDWPVAATPTFVVHSFGGVSYEPESLTALTLRLQHVSDQYHRQVTFEFHSVRAELWRVIRMICQEYQQAYLATDFLPAVHEVDDDPTLDLLRLDVQAECRIIADGHLLNLKEYLRWSRANVKRLRTDMRALAAKVKLMEGVRNLIWGEVDHVVWPLTLVGFQSLREIKLYDASYNIQRARDTQSLGNLLSKKFMVREEAELKGLGAAYHRLQTRRGKLAAPKRRAA